MGPADPNEVVGEESAVVDGVLYALGDKVVLTPGTDGDPFDKWVHGKTATIERIMVAYDDRVHLGVTVDDDPGADLLRDTGRFLYFFPDQVEHVP